MLCENQLQPCDLLGASLSTLFRKPRWKVEGKGLVRTCVCPLEDPLPSAKVTGPASAFSFKNKH